MSFRPRQDNVLLRLLPRDSETASGIALVHINKPGTKEHRQAEVVAVGPGHYQGCRHCGGERGVFIPTSVRPGQIVVVDALCGDTWSSFDVSVPRHNASPDFDAVGGERAEWRVAREEEILAVVEPEAQAAE